MLDIEVQGLDCKFLPLFDIQLGLLTPYPGRTISVRPIMINQIDYHLLSRWLQYCDDHHFHSCRRIKENGVPGFKAINCIKRCVEILDPCETDYTALSYVWGSPTAAHDETSDFPPTVEDSIAVTIALGYQYLWVDRYVSSSSSALLRLGLMRSVH